MGDEAEMEAFKRANWGEGGLGKGLGGVGDGSDGDLGKCLG
jgi:hypothetical protein